MDRMIFIAGEGHSGSTLLDMLLSSGGKAVSLGQIMSVVNRQGDRIIQGQCSCGQSAADCPLWGPVLSKFVELGNSASLQEKYSIVFDQVAALYGPKMHVIDSSKFIGSLLKIESFADFEIAPIQVIKDVRSFSVSMVDKAIKRHGKAPAFEPERLFLNWYRHNRKIDRHLKASDKYTDFRVVYEELVFMLESSISSINEYLGDSYIDLNGAFNSHVISGNRMKNKIGTPKDIRYDFRWLARSEWLRPYVLMPFVSRYNSQIYKVLNEKNFNKFNLLYQK